METGITQYLELRRMTPGVIPGIPYPWPKVTDMVEGMAKPQMIVLGARPGIGKTSLMSQIAIHTAQWLLEENRPEMVRIITSEMEVEALQMRMISQLSGVPIQKMRRGLSTDWQHQKALEAWQLLKRLPIEYLRPRDIDQIKKFIDNTTIPTALYCVDYLQITPYRNTWHGDEFGRISKLSNAFREFSLRYAPGLILSQMSRYSERREDPHPTMSDLKGSGDIEQDASVIIMPYRAKDESPDVGEGKDMELHVVKSRDGVTGVVYGKWHGYTMSFTTQNE